MQGYCFWTSNRKILLLESLTKWGATNTRKAEKTYCQNLSIEEKRGLISDPEWQVIELSQIAN